MDINRHNVNEKNCRGRNPIHNSSERHAFENRHSIKSPELRCGITVTVYSTPIDVATRSTTTVISKLSPNPNPSTLPTSPFRAIGGLHARVARAQASRLLHTG